MLRTLTGLSVVTFTVTAVLLVVAPDSARFAVAAFFVTISLTGLAMATNAGGTAEAMTRSASRLPRFLPVSVESPKVARVWGAIVAVFALFAAVQATLDENF